MKISSVESYVLVFGRPDKISLIKLLKQLNHSLPMRALRFVVARHQTGSDEIKRRAELDGLLERIRIEFHKSSDDFEVRTLLDRKAQRRHYVGIDIEVGVGLGVQKRLDAVNATGTDGEDQWRYLVERTVDYGLVAARNHEPEDRRLPVQRRVMQRRKVHLVEMHCMGVG